MKERFFDASLNLSRAAQLATVSFEEFASVMGDIAAINDWLEKRDRKRRLKQQRRARIRRRGWA